MAGQCIYPMLICPCCGRDDAVQRFRNPDNSVTSFCMKCKTPFNADKTKEIEGEKPVRKTVEPKDISKEIQEITEEYPVKPLPDRGLTKATLEYFGVKVGVSKKNGQDVVQHMYPLRKGNEIVAYHVRICEPKLFFFKGPMKEADPFGWQEAMAARGKFLVVTEGQIDTMTLYRVWRMKYKGQNYEYLPVISLKNGASSVFSTFSAEHVDKIKKKFDKIVFAGDCNEEVGEKAAEDMVKLFGDFPVHVCQYSENDPNDMHLAGKDEELIQAVWDAKVPMRSSIIEADKALWDLALKPAPWGLSWPFKDMNDATRGIRLGEVTYIGSGQKMGKGELADTLAVHLMKEHKEKPYIAKTEQAPARTLKKLAGKAAHQIFDDPKVSYTVQEFNAARKMIDGKFFLYDRKLGTNWDEFKETIRQAVLLGGSKYILVEPITTFVPEDASEGNTFLIQMAKWFQDAAFDLGFHAFLFCHLNNPSYGAEHTRGGKVKAEQFAGSRAMIRHCNYTMGLQGNKDPEQEYEKIHRRELVLLDDRDYGETCIQELRYNKNTGCFEEL